MGTYERAIRGIWRSYMRAVERRVQRVQVLGGPLERRAHPTQPPVLLVPGYGNEHASMGAIRRSLERDGFRAAAVTLPGLGFDDAVEDTRFLLERVRAVATETGSTEVDLVGHSRGGLVARAAQQQGGGIVGRVVTLASANQGLSVGMPLARLLPAGMRQIRADTPFMRDLRAFHGDGRGVDVVTVGTSGIDWVLAPASLTWLDGSPRLVIDEGRRLGAMSRLTHYSMLRDDLAYESIRAALLLPRTRAATFVT